jgi:hypothetical protein
MSIRESWGVLWLVIRLPSERADVSSSVIKAFFLVQLGYLEVTVQEKLRSVGQVHSWKLRGVVISHSFVFRASRRLKFSYKNIFPCTARVFRSDSPGEAAQWLAKSIRERWGVLWLVIRLFSVRADVSISVIKVFFLVQLGYLDVTVQEKLRSGWPGPFVKVEGCCD